MAPSHKNEVYNKTPHRPEDHRGHVCNCALREPSRLPPRRHEWLVDEIPIVRQKPTEWIGHNGEWRRDGSAAAEEGEGTADGESARACVAGRCAPLFPDPGLCLPCPLLHAPVPSHAGRRRRRIWLWLRELPSLRARRLRKPACRRLVQPAGERSAGRGAACESHFWHTNLSTRRRRPTSQNCVIDIGSGTHEFVKYSPRTPTITCGRPERICKAQKQESTHFTGLFTRCFHSPVQLWWLLRIPGPPPAPAGTSATRGRWGRLCYPKDPRAPPRKSLRREAPQGTRGTAAFGTCGRHGERSPPQLDGGQRDDSKAGRDKPRRRAGSPGRATSEKTADVALRHREAKVGRRFRFLLLRCHPLARLVVVAQLITCASYRREWRSARM